MSPNFINDGMTGSLDNHQLLHNCHSTQIL